MRVFNLVFSLLILSISSASWSQNLTFAGSCSWGPQILNGENCMHLASHALATLYKDKKTGKTFVYNRITTTNENFCTPPTETPSIKNLILSNGFWWNDIGSQKISKADVNEDLRGQLQLSTNSYNDLEARNHQQVIFYAPCFLADTSPSEMTLKDDIAQKFRESLRISTPDIGTLVMRAYISEKPGLNRIYRLVFIQGDKKITLSGSDQQNLLKDMFLDLKNAGVKIKFANEGSSYEWLHIELSCPNSNLCLINDLND